MRATLARRIERIEAAVLQPAEPTYQVLHLPREDAPGHIKEQFRKDLSAAEALCDRVWVVDIGRNMPEDISAKVRYVAGEVEAEIEILATRRSKLGNRSALDDVLQGLSGNVLVPASDSGAPWHAKACGLGPVSAARSGPSADLSDQD